MTHHDGPSKRREEAAIFDLEDEVPNRPDLPGEVIVAPTADELIDRLAAELVLHAENCVRMFGDFHLALSGGPTFERLYERLMYDPNYRRLPWRRTHLWFVEERCVPLVDEHSNYRMINEIIGDHADIPREQFHPIVAESNRADTDYEAQLREALAWREKGQDRLDYVLLTMEEDGGTAGITPGSDLLHEERRLIGHSPARSGSDVDSVGMTPLVINAARLIAVLITGDSKADAVHRLATDRGSPDEMPIRGIAPLNGELKWYLDGPSCRRCE